MAGPPVKEWMFSIALVEVGLVVADRQGIIGC